MSRDKQREIRYIIAKSCGNIDVSIAEQAYDMLPSWRDINNDKVYIISLVEDEYDFYWVGINADKEELKYIDIHDGIGTEILEYSLPDVSNTMFDLLIKDKMCDFCETLASLSMHNNRILYIKLKK